MWPPRVRSKDLYLRHEASTAQRNRLRLIADLCYLLRYFSVKIQHLSLMTWRNGDMIWPNGHLTWHNDNVNHWENVFLEQWRFTETMTCLARTVMCLTRLVTRSNGLVILHDRIVPCLWAMAICIAEAVSNLSIIMTYLAEEVLFLAR